MIKVNEILVYNLIKDSYYTDGKDVYVQIKERRVSCNGIRYKINPYNVFDINDITKNYYVFEGDALYKKLKWQVDWNGYHFITTDPKGRPRKISRHRLVYFFHNNIIPDEGMVIDHINRNKQDNNLSNLQLCTAKENRDNVDKRAMSIASSRYLYKCTDINTLDVVEGTAGDIQNAIGIDSGLVNRYAKRGYKYRNKYTIEITERRY